MRARTRAHLVAAMAVSAALLGPVGPALAATPSVTKVTPADGATGVSKDTAVAAEVNLPNLGEGVDATTLTPASVQLIDLDHGNTPVDANRNTSGGGDVIVLQPTQCLTPSTTYRFVVTTGVKDTGGNAFAPFQSTFTTGTSGCVVPRGVGFTKTTIDTGQRWTSLAVGPDGKLYGLTLDGFIYRWTLNADGTAAGAAQVIDSLRAYEGLGHSYSVGFAFDPKATAGNLVAWVTNTDNYTTSPLPDDFSGKIVRLSGPDLGTVQDWVVGLPRSIRDHVTNSIAFDVTGKMYVAQGSVSAMGAPDSAWGNRPEHLLSASILQITPSAITSPPFNVTTEGPNANPSFNPRSPSSPVRLYATGVRNAYDLLWHSNRELYAPTNGSAAGGNTPASSSPHPGCSYSGPNVPGVTNVGAQHDWLFRIQQGRYYGHPNPIRCEFVLNGGNPTAGRDPAEVVSSPQFGGYPVGTQPDANWDGGTAYDFGLHYSPDGVIEYTGTAFGKFLTHKILVARYSAGDDIMALNPGAQGKITDVTTGIPGLTGFDNPLDIAQGGGTKGYLYVSEFGGVGRITLLKPVDSGIKPKPVTLLFNDQIGGGPSGAQQAVLQNTSGTAMTITGLSIVDDTIPADAGDAALFGFAPRPSLPQTLAAGQSLKVPVNFDPAATGAFGALLRVDTDQVTKPIDVTLRGLGTSGEPPLQDVLDTLQMGVDVNTDEVATTGAFRRAGPGVVTLAPVAAFTSPGPGGTAVTVGTYTPGTPASVTNRFTIPNGSASTLTFGKINSTFKTTATFGFFADFPGVGSRVFSRDSDNAGATKRVRVFHSPVTDRLIICLEDGGSGAPDFQDIVFTANNVNTA